MGFILITTKDKIVRYSFFLLSLMPFAILQAYEGTARPIFDAPNDLKVMQIVPVCANGSLVAVSGTRLVCAQPPRLSCRIVQSSGGITFAAESVLCDDDEAATGGGGFAEIPSGSGLCGNTSAGFLHTVAPFVSNTRTGFYSNGYRFNWGGEACTRAYAICCKIVN